MRRAAATVLVTFAALMAVATSATAATPVAQYTVPDGGVATCLRDARDGRFGLAGPVEGARNAIDVLQLGAGGLAPSSRTTLGWLPLCPAVAGAAGGGVLLAGAAVTADPQDGPFEEQLRVAPAGGTPVALGGPQNGELNRQVLAINAAGAAVVAWTETPSVAGRRPPRSRVLAAVRPAGSVTFGPATVVDQGVESFGPAQVVAGIDADGRATLAWVGDGPGLNPQIVVASSDAGGTFHVDQRIDNGVVDDMTLVVNADGRALLAALSGAIGVYDRQPGETRFARAAVLVDEQTLDTSAVSAALGSQGEAIVATSGRDGLVSYATRPTAGTFGAVRALTHPRPHDGSLSSFGLAALRPAPPIETDPSAQLSTAIAGDQVVVAWVDARAVTPNAAFGTVSGGLGAPERLGSLCRPADGVRAVVLPDGAVAVAWTDNARALLEFGEAFAQGGGRLSVVRAGPTPAPAGPAPQVRATLESSSLLHVGTPLEIRVRCAGGPCDVRAQSQARGVASPSSRLPSSADEEDQVVAATTSAAPSGTSLRLKPLDTASFVAPGRRARGRVVVTACSPDGAQSTTVTLHPSLRGAPLRPIPRIVAASATRQGLRVRVVVRTDRPVHGLVYAAGRPSGTTRDTFDSARGRGRRHFVLDLEGTARAPLRSVQLSVVNHDGFSAPERTIRVR